ncbi:hypothetical protein D9M68_974770 [compost metagenome]
MYTLEGLPPPIHHIHAFHPDFHVARGTNADIPGVIGQFGAAVATGAPGQSQDKQADPEALEFRTLTRSHKGCRAA